MLEDEDKKWIQDLIETHQHQGADSFKISAGGGSGGFSRCYTFCGYGQTNNNVIPVTCGFAPRLFICQAMTFSTTVNSKSFSTLRIDDAGNKFYNTVWSGSTWSDCNQNPIIYNINGPTNADLVYGEIQNITATGFQVKTNKSGSPPTATYVMIVLG